MLSPADMMFIIAMAFIITDHVPRLEDITM